MRALGYIAGHSYEIDLVEAAGVWLESATAAAFLRMREAAARDSIALVPSMGFRSHEEQTQIWEARRCLCVPERMRNTSRNHTNPKCPVSLYGPVARPGTSAHQSGHAVDIKTGLTYHDFGAGKTTPIFRWLHSHCAVFGFARTVRREPWHYEFVRASEDRDVT